MASGFGQGFSELLGRNQDAFNYSGFSDDERSSTRIGSELASMAISGQAEIESAKERARVFKEQQKAQSRAQAGSTAGSIGGAVAGAAVTGLVGALV